MSKKITARLSEKELYDFLIKDIKDRGLYQPVYVDKVNEYVRLWKLQQMYFEDVEERGVIEAVKSGKEATAVSKQLQSLFKALGFQDIMLMNMKPQTEDSDEL